MVLKNLILIVLACVVIYLYYTFAGDKPDRLVAALVIATEKDHKNLDVDFNSPVRYLGHFPESRGELFQIRLRPITFEGFTENYSMLDYFLKRGLPDDANLLDIRYEGDVPGGPLIVIQFKTPMDVNIKESGGLRGLHISYKPA